MTESDGTRGQGRARVPSDPTSEVERRLLDAVGHHRLDHLLDTDGLEELTNAARTDDDRALIDETRATAGVIAAALRRDADLISAVVAEIAPLAPRVTVGEYAQQHTLTVRVEHADEAELVADALAPHGFARRDRWTRGAARSFRRHSALLTLVRPDPAADGHTTSLRLRWADDHRRSPLDRLVRPTAGDWATVTLPNGLAWAYPAVRIGRLAAERTGLRRPHASGLGPYLTTPASLIEPLLDHAGVRSGSRLVDLGAGDGRIVAAAARRGASALGIEHDRDLATHARRRLADAGVSGEIRESDVRDLLDAPSGPLASADAVVMFLPVDVAVGLVPRLRSTMSTGSRIVLHEQHRLPNGSAPPDRSALLVGRDALTIAHTWHV